MYPAPADSPPPTPAPPPSRHPAVLAGIGALAVVLVAVVAFLAFGGKDDGGGDASDESAGSALGSAVGGDSTTVPSNVGTAVQETTIATAGLPADLPPVTIPEESTPPTTIPGSEPGSVPGADGDLPLFGHLVVDVDPGGYQDFAVYLREDQQFQLLSLADDGIMTHIEVFAPDGSSEGTWDGGEPGVINGLEWFGDEKLPATGTYVIRVIHTGGSDDRFVLAFFGAA
jgi:hypothetical protein